MSILPPSGWTGGPATGTSLSAIQAILKEDYQDAIRDQLHRDLRILQLFEKGKASWNGRQFIIPMRVGGNTGVSFKGEGSQLPNAGSQRFVRILNSAKFLYARFQVGGPDIAAAANGGAMGLVSTVSDEMTYLVEDVKDYADKKMYHGGQVKGFIVEKAAGLTTATGGSAWSTAGDEETLTLQYFGDHSYFDECVAGTPSTWVRVDIVRQDTMAVCAPTNLGQVYVVASDASASPASTITLAVVETAGGASQLDLTLSGLSIAAEVPFSVSLADKGVAAAPHATLGAVLNEGGFRFDKTAAGYSSSNVDYNAALEFSGLIDNLANVDHHGVSRATEATLRSTVLCYSEASVGEAVAMSSGNINRIQKVIDVMRNKSRRKPDVLITNPLTRHKYIGAASLTQNVQAGSISGLDLGTNEDSLGFAGIPMQVDSNCPPGMLFGLHTASWKVFELKPGDFDDTDGKILHQVAGYDRYEGFWKWYLELICDYPSANMIVVGFLT